MGYNKPQSLKQRGL